MGRQRKDRKTLLPFGLRERDGYYSYTNPVDGREYGLGRNKRDAIAQAIEANAALRKTPSLLDRISGADMTWGAWCNRFEKILANRTLKPNTVRQNKSKMSRLRRSFEADRTAKGITTKDVAEVLNAIKNEGKNRTAQAFRSFLLDCFDRMVAEGVRTDNPARVTDDVSVKIRRARLTLEIYRRVYDATEVVWLKNAMALALVSGQDRDSCARARFADFHDGYWWIERTKTGARIMIPTSLRLEAFGMSLDDVVRQCRATGIVSANLVHQTKRVRGARLGKKLHIDMLTRAFREEIAKLGLDWGGRTPPTFHEIRSLSTRLYDDQADGVNTQELLGHTESATTDIYRDGRGEWVKVSIGKKPSS